MAETKGQPDGPSHDPAEKLVPSAIPALVDLLVILERKKGSPLTEEEVCETRDNMICMMVAESRARAVDEARGYRDLNPDRAWEEWQLARREIFSD